MSCAQSSCPALIQADCARFSEELDHFLPSVSFGARDGSASDLPNTVVYVDGVLVAMHLEDGKSYEMKPGKHVVRFVHDGKETTLNVVLNQGEKGRALIGVFADARVATTSPSAGPPPPLRPRRSLLPLAVGGLGAVALATGAVLIAVGLHDVPGSCSMSTQSCAAPPGDSSFDDAHRAVSLANAGVAIGVGGTLALVGGVAWYFLQPAPRAADTVGTQLITPWVGAGSGGLSVHSTF